MKLIEKANEKIGMAASLVLFLITYSVSDKSLLFGLIKLPEALYQSNAFAPLGFYSSTFASADYFPLLPWLFMFLFGAFLGKYAKDGALPESFYKSRCKLLSKIGKNSLWVYLFHQPVLYLIMYIISFIQLIFI